MTYKQHQRKRISSHNHIMLIHNKGEIFWILSFYVRSLTLLHLAPLRFSCVGGCWDRTRDCCDFGIDSQRLDLIRYSARTPSTCYYYLLIVHLCLTFDHAATAQSTQITTCFKSLAFLVLSVRDPCSYVIPNPTLSPLPLGISA